MAPARTLRVGKQLHIALAVVKILPTSPRLLEPGKIYSYDLEIDAGNETHTLKSLGLLTTGTVNHRRVEALGFEENFLPGFALPPAEITDLHVLFGSCRRPGNTHLDAMVWIDDLMSGNNLLADSSPSRRTRPSRVCGAALCCSRTALRESCSTRKCRARASTSRATTSSRAGSTARALHAEADRALHDRRLSRPAEKSNNYIDASLTAS